MSDYPRKNSTNYWNALRKWNGSTLEGYKEGSAQSAHMDKKNKAEKVRLAESLEKPIQGR